MLIPLKSAPGEPGISSEATEDILACLDDRDPCELAASSLLCANCRPSSLVFRLSFLPLEKNDDFPVADMLEKFPNQKGSCFNSRRVFSAPRSSNVYGVMTFAVNNFALINVSTCTGLRHHAPTNPASVSFGLWKLCWQMLKSRCQVK
jgi:hypothetical protein